MKPYVIFVVGPTASGKTDLAVKLGKYLSSEVISADSMQIYKGMHIASAAPDAGETGGVPHSMVEFLPYGAAFTVADYAEAARREIDRVISNGLVPVVVGGTGLYISALADNIKFLPVKTDLKLRARLEREYDETGGEKMLSRLYIIDPAAAEKLQPGDKRRIVRALEIYETSGVTKSVQNAVSKQEPPCFTPIMIGLNFKDRQKLYEKINRRVDLMMEKGLLDEAKAAFEAGVKAGGAQAIGHKEFFGYFRGEQTLGEAVETLKRSTRRYAKRQLTWFNNDSRVNWIYVDESEDVYADALKIIEKEKNENA